MAIIQWITNSGTSDWSVSANWSPTGVPGAADSATIGVAGTVTVTVNTAESVGSLTLADANATVALNNSLTLGSTLVLTAGTFDLNSGGTLVGGTITGSGLLSQGGTLSGVTNQGTLDLSASASRLTVTNGLTLRGTGGTGPGSLLLTGGNSYLLFSGTQTLDNAAVSIGGTSGTGFLYETGAGATLTLGPNLSITQTGRSARLDANAGDAIVNTGTINAGVTSGGLYVVGSGGFTNQGTINVSNGDDFEVFTTVSGTGTIDLASGALVSLRSAVGSGQVVSFVDGTGRLSLSQPGSFAGSVQGFQRGDTIDVKGIGLAASYTYNSTSHLLTLNNGGGTQVAQITLSTSAATPLFTIGTDGGGGTMFAVLSQSYFIGTYTSGIVLSNPAIQQPSTVAATGSVTNTTTAHSGDAVYGTNAAAWDFTNLGTLTATGANSKGVELIAGGTVSNVSTAASITGV